MRYRPSLNPNFPINSDWQSCIELTLDGKSADRLIRLSACLGLITYVRLLPKATRLSVYGVTFTIRDELLLPMLADPNFDWRDKLLEPYKHWLGSWVRVSHGVAEKLRIEAGKYDITSLSDGVSPSIVILRPRDGSYRSVCLTRDVVNGLLPRRMRVA